MKWRKETDGRASLQHINKMLRDQQHFFTEPQILLTKAQALHGEFEAMILSLSDEELTHPDTADPEWSVERVVEHMAEVERGYRGEILKSVEKARTGASIQIGRATGS